MTVRKGFTLIELLVVVVIIAILAAVALPQYQKAVRKSRLAEVKMFHNAAEKAIKAYILQNGVTETIRRWDLDIGLDFNPTHGLWSAYPKAYSADSLMRWESNKYSLLGGVETRMQYDASTGDVTYKCTVLDGQYAQLGVETCRELAGDDPRWTIFMPSSMY